MTKALVTIEVDIDTDHVYSLTLESDSTRMSYPGIAHLQNEERNWIWDCVANWLQNQNDFITVKKVSLIKKVGA